MRIALDVLCRNHLFGFILVPLKTVRLPCYRLPEKSESLDSFPNSRFHLGYWLYHWQLQPPPPPSRAFSGNLPDTTRQNTPLSRENGKHACGPLMHLRGGGGAYQLLAPKPCRFHARSWWTCRCLSTAGRDIHLGRKELQTRAVVGESAACVSDVHSANTDSLHVMDTKFQAQLQENNNVGRRQREDYWLEITKC